MFKFSKKLFTILSISIVIILICITQSCKKEKDESSNNSQIIPIADFYADTTMIKINDAIDYYDLSTGNPNKWNWEFEGGNPSTSSLQNPVSIIYNSIGKFDVTLTVSNEYGETTKKEIDYITVLPLSDSGFFNDFKSGNADNWIPVDGQWFVEDNVYKVTSNNILYANTCYFDKDFSDFIFEVKARKTEGLTCNIGIAFRGDPSSVTPLGNWNSTYKLILCTDARWSIGKLVNGSYEEFKWGVSNEANTGMGEWNVLKVICANGNIDVFFNDAKQGSFYDTTFLSGKVGITMYDQYFSGKAEFDYVRLSTTLKNYTFGPIDQPEFRRRYSSGSNRGDCPGEDDENRKTE
jgi:PKD repeat protein